MAGAAQERDRAGRPPATSRAELERVALALFERNGFEATTVDDIALAAGISRRTFFRYFASKNDVVWGDFDAGLRRMTAALEALPDEVDLWESLAATVIRINALPPDTVPAHRQRMTLILEVPALHAHSTLRYTAWRDAIAGFAARRLDAPVGSLAPQLVGHVALGAAVAAYEQWLRDEQADLQTLLHDAFRRVAVTTGPAAPTAAGARRRGRRPPRP